MVGGEKEVDGESIRTMIGQNTMTNLKLVHFSAVPLSRVPTTSQNSCFIIAHVGLLVVRAAWGDPGLGLTL